MKSDVLRIRTKIHGSATLLYRYMWYRVIIPQINKTMHELLVLGLHMRPELVPPRERGIAEAAAHAQSHVLLLHVARHVPLVGAREAALQAHPEPQPRHRHRFLQLCHHARREGCKHTQGMSESGGRGVVVWALEAVLRIQDPVPFRPLDPGWVKSQDPEWTARIIFPRA